MKRYSWATWAVGVSAAVGMLVTAGSAYAAVPTLSQSNVTVGVGQSTSVTATNGVGVYVGSNQSQTIASVLVNGSQITVQGMVAGTDSLSVCAVNTADCTNLAVTVQTGSVSSAITFSPTSLSLSTGGNQAVTITGGNGAYTLSNSNTGVASTVLSGTTLTVTGVAAGNATITVCDTTNLCGTLSVTVSSSSTTGTGLTFNPSSISIALGNNQASTVSGGNGSYQINKISSTNVISAGQNGSSITVVGMGTGSATVTVCDTSNTNTCGTLSVTVTATSASSGLTFSQSNISLMTGGSQAVTVSGGNGSYHVSTISNTSAVSGGTSSTGVTVYAAGAGNATVTVCDSSNNVCGTLNVTVAAPATNSNQAFSFSVANPSVAVGQSLNVTISGTPPSYFISSNTNPNIAQASIENSVIVALTGTAAGSDSITICAIGGAGCASLPVTVTGPTAPVVTTPAATVTQPTTVAAPVAQSASVVANAALLTEIQTLQNAITQILTQVQSVQSQISQLEAQVSAGSGSSIGTIGNGVSSGGTGTFTETLTLGTQDAQVTALQERLVSLGFLSGAPTGYYGSLTQAAVSKYQTAHGLTATGSVGPGTRAALNAGN